MFVYLYLNIVYISLIKGLILKLTLLNLKFQFKFISKLFYDFCISIYCINNFGFPSSIKLIYDIIYSKNHKNNLFIDQFSIDFLKNQAKYNQELLKIVEAHGGNNCKHWTQVARLYFQRTGVAEPKTYNLKKRYQILTKYSENITKEQECVLLITGIQCRGLNKAGVQDFQTQTGCNMFRGRYSLKMAKFLTLAFKTILSSFMHKKGSKNNPKMNVYPRISYVDIHILLKAADIKENIEDPIFKEIQICSVQLEQLLFKHVYCKEKDLSERYKEYSQIVNRKQFKRIFFFLIFCGDLKRVSLEQCDEECQRRNPLIKKTVAENKQSIYYQYLISERDWQEKYNLFLNCSKENQQNDQFSLLLKKHKKKDLIIDDEKGNQEFDFVPKVITRLSNKVAKATIESKRKQKQMRCFRGHYVQSGQIKTTGQTTIYFDHDVDSAEIENDDFEKELERQKQNEELEKQKEHFIKIYNQMFANDEKQEQQQKEKQRKQDKLAKKARTI